VSPTYIKVVSIEEFYYEFLQCQISSVDHATRMPTDRVQNFLPIIDSRVKEMKDRIDNCKFMQQTMCKSLVCISHSLISFNLKYLLLVSKISIITTV
jgi:hypothetical protein